MLIPLPDPASAVSSFVPNRLATWRPLNILRPSQPPILLPTSNFNPTNTTTTTNNNNTTTHHQTKPVHVHTHVNVPKQKREKRQKSKSRCWLIILIIVLIYLLGNNIFLNIRVANLTSSTSSNTNSSGGSSSGPSQAVKDCLSQFKLNAPSDPSSFPCSTCAPVLQTIPNDFSTSSTDGVTGQGAALQFCALGDIVRATTNSSSLQAVGWLKDADPCTSWNGIQCDTKGRVTSLTLVFPGVPAALPASMASGLVGLQTLSITGDGNVPAGSVLSSSSSSNGNSSASVLAIPSLQSVLLQSTALTGPLPDTFFAASTNLTSLQLVNNPHLGDSLPTSLFTLPSLKSLVVNGQGLTQVGGAINSAANGIKASLTTLDLSNNALSGSLPDLSAFSSLVEINLASNQFSALVGVSTSSGSDDGFPSGLQTLNIANNSALSGSVPSTLCASTALKSCDLRSTQLGVNGADATTGSCGVCQFGSQ